MSVVNRPFRVALSSVLALSLWPFAAGAQQSACLNDQNKKVCVSLVSSPTRPDTVQAARLDGTNDTWVRYTATITNVIHPSSSRNLDATFTVTPTDLLDFEGGGGACTKAGSTVSCRFDKLQDRSDVVIGITARAPLYAGQLTPDEQVLKAVFGWQGRTASASQSVPVSTTDGGSSWVPAGQGVTLTTAAATDDPAHQTTESEPVFVRMTVPPAEQPFTATLTIDEATGADFSQACAGNLFLRGPYLCRDIGRPAGNPQRWVRAELEPELVFTQTPVTLEFIWDDTIVPDEQQGTPPNGVPPVAIFYLPPGQSADPLNYRAFADPCATGVGAPKVFEPCVTGVQEYGTGDLTATLHTSNVDLLAARRPLSGAGMLAALQQVLDELLRIAHGGVLDPGGIMR